MGPLQLRQAHAEIHQISCPRWLALRFRCAHDMRRMRNVDGQIPEGLSKNPQLSKATIATIN